MAGTTLRERKDAAPRIVVVPQFDHGAVRVCAIRMHLYGRTSPRSGLCDFDAYGMDIVEGRA